MNLRLWLAYCVLEAALSLSPGPAVFTIIAQAIRHGWKKSFWGNLGIGAGNCTYFFLSALGVGAFIAASPKLYALLRFAGIGYLAFTAIKLLFARASESSSIRAAEGSRKALFLQALTTQLSNPKTIIFFVSFLAPFLDVGSRWPIALQIAVFAATTLIIEIPILLFYGFIASHGSRMLPKGQVGVWQDRVAGTCLLAASLWLLLR